MPLLATLLSLLASASATVLPLTGLRSLIVGGGPSGLLLAHRLLDAGDSVSLLDTAACVIVHDRHCSGRWVPFGPTNAM